MNNIFEKFILLFKKYYLGEEAYPLHNNTNLKLNNYMYSLHSGGSKNKNEIFYIIQRSPGAGLFSNLIFVLNHLKIAEKHKFTSFIDMQNFPTIYNEPKSIDGTKNSWEYFFHQTSNKSAIEVKKSKNIITTSNIFYKDFTSNPKKLRKIFKKKIKIKKKYLKVVKLYYDKNIKGNKVLAIHYRGTSYKTSAGHPFPPTLKQMNYIIDKFILKKKFDKIFLCTEDKKMFNQLKKRYSKKIISIKSYRSLSDDAFKIYPRKNHRYKLGKEILIEALIMSKCDSLLSTETNVSNFIKIINGNSKPNFYRIENSYNSTNEYYAMWIWYLKKILPKFFFGFGSTLNYSKH
jgi:hypothetical protein